MLLKRGRGVTFTSFIIKVLQKMFIMMRLETFGSKGNDTIIARSYGYEHPILPSTKQILKCVLDTGISMYL